MTAEEINILISKGEGLQLEFKQTFNVETIETLVAFANTNGGKVLIGVSDAGTIAGISINSESVQNWINEIKHKTSPSLIPDVAVYESNYKTVVVFSIQEYPIKPVATRGKYFKRNANSNQILNIVEVVNLHLQSFNTSWDFYINNQFKINDISLYKVQVAIDTLNQTISKINDDPLTFLLKNDLLRDGQLTNAAYLLFTERDTVFTTIEMGRFQTETIIKDSTRTKSDILSQVDQVMDFVKKHINKEVIITGQPRNIQKWQYPLEAIREIITNMVVHRDYRSTSDSIVKVFDNRIEFYNPGRLPDSISVEDLLSNNYKSTPRNKLIADFCKSVGLIEKYGSGIRRIVEYFAEAQLPHPEFRNISDGFMVTIFVSPMDNAINEKSDPIGGRIGGQISGQIGGQITETQQKILHLIIENNKISRKEVSDKIGINESAVQKQLKNLIRSGIIERVDGTRGFWEVNKKNEY